MQSCKSIPTKKKPSIPPQCTPPIPPTQPPKTIVLQLSSSNLPYPCPPIPLPPPQISPLACFSVSSLTYRRNFSILLSFLGSGLGLRRETPTPSVICPPTGLGARVELMGGFWDSEGEAEAE